MGSSDPKGAVSAATRNSPGAPAESPVERRAVWETRRVSDRVHTGKLPQRTQPKPTPEGTARAHPIAGPRTGTTRTEPKAPASAGASGRHKEPGSRPASTCPAQPPSKSRAASPRDGERHHGVRKDNPSTASDQTGRGAALQCRATRHARETRRRPQPRHTNRCRATAATGCHKQGSTHISRRTTAQEQAPGNTQPTHHKTPARGGGVQAERAHKHKHLNTPARRGGAQPKPEPKHTHPHRTFQ